MWYDGKRIHEPQMPEYYPHKRFVQWHFREVFWGEREVWIDNDSLIHAYMSYTRKQKRERVKMVNTSVTFSFFLNEAFKLLGKDYVSLLARYYPAHNSTGFTENNQTFHYIRNLYAILLNLGDNPIVWFEAPLPDNRGRIDAMLISEKFKTAVFIEAKRFRNYNHLKMLNDDITRLLEEENRKHILKEYCDKESIENEYILYLADVWAETKWKTAVYNHWDIHDSQKNILKKERDGSAFGWESHKICRFKEKKLTYDCLDKYALLMGHINV